MHGMTAGAAFICIANMLELMCSEEGFHIGACVSTLPPPIVPTLKQQTIPHLSYIDMLPWSSLRDRMLISPTAINDWEFVNDMGTSDLRVWGSTPWDPMGWEVGPEFARKWWFLMDDGIVHTSNFWRRQRGEETLVLTPP
jgi:hypothetical protein